MAFVSQSPRAFGFQNQATSQQLGPGIYETEKSSVLKERNSTKKNPPFGIAQTRDLTRTNESSQYTPGPGSYKLIPSEFEKHVQSKELEENNTYLINDNGHVNKRTQGYAQLAQKGILIGFGGTIQSGINLNSLTYTQPTPGPGSYDTNASSFAVINEQSKPPFKRKHLSPVSMHSNQVLNQSIPSIPSRYLMPNLDADPAMNQSPDNNNNQYNSTVGSKVKKLVEDKTKIGPGYYKYSDAVIKQSPRSMASWGTSKTSRIDHFIKTSTMPSIGPGAYNAKKEIDRRLYNSSFTKEGNIIQREVKRSRDHIYDEDSEDEMDLKISPGPGDYLNQSQISTFVKSSIKKPDQFQFFGSSVERFTKESNILNNTGNIGPGHYNTNYNLNPKRPYKESGSSSFLSPQRDGPLNQNEDQMPGPADYN